MIAKSFSFLECGVVSRVTNWANSTYQFNSPHIDSRYQRETFLPLDAQENYKDNEGGFRHFHGGCRTSYDLGASLSNEFMSLPVEDDITISSHHSC